MTEAAPALYREVRDTSDQLPPLTARAYLEQSAERSDDSEIVLAVLALHAFDRGQPDFGSKVCARLLAKGRTAWSVGAEAYHQLLRGTPEEAASLATEAVGIDSGNPYVASIASGLASLRGSVDEARDLAYQAYRCDPANPEAYGQVLQAATLVYDWEGAKSLLSEVPPEFVGTAAYFAALGNIARADERHEDAIEALRTATDLNPYRPMPWVQLGTVLLKLKRFPEAKLAAGRALELNPNNGAALTLAARLAEADRNFAERDRLLHQAASHSAVSKPFSHGHAAERFIQTGMPTEALRALELMELEGGFAAKQAARVKKLGPLADLGRWIELERTLSSLEGSQVGQPMKLLASARLAAHRGDVPSAIARLEAVFAAKPTDGQNLRWLLIFASEAADHDCLDRVAEIGKERLTETAEAAFRFIATLYGAKALNQGDRVLAEAQKRFPDAPKLQAAEAWRLDRIGAPAAARALRMRLPMNLRTWRPVKSLRPPKPTYWYAVGRQLRRRFLGY